MSHPDLPVEVIAHSLPAVTGDELDQLLARSAHVARNAICITDAGPDGTGFRDDVVVLAARRTARLDAGRST